jgi:endonuclease YncB( thermonuclease family)
MSRYRRAAILAVLVALGLGGLGAAYDGAQEAHVARVIDGDTFAIESGEKIRIRNFDTAELRRYACPEEKAAAMLARDVARDWLDGRRVTLIVDGQDRYGRIVADVIVHGPDGPYNFADRMAAEGYGAHWDYGREPQPEWCPTQAAGAATGDGGEERGALRAIGGWLWGG